MQDYKNYKAEEGNIEIGIGPLILAFAFLILFLTANHMDYNDHVRQVPTKCEVKTADYGRESATVCKKVKSQ